MSCQAVITLLVSASLFLPAQEAVRKPARPLAEALAASDAAAAAGAEATGAPSRKLANPQPVASSSDDAIVVNGDEPSDEFKAKPESGAELRFTDWRSTITSPRPGATLGNPQRFDWTPSAGAQEYWLWVGSCQDCTDIYDASLGLRRSESVWLPTDGRRIYVTLFTFFDNTWWWWDYQYVAPRSGGQRAAFVTPTSGATLDATQTFTWSRGTNVTEYWLWIGSCQDCTDILDESQGQRVSRTVAVPTNGRVIYVTLFSLINNDWYWIDYQFRAPTATGGTATLVVTNKLVYAINLLVNGRTVGSVPAGETRETTQGGDSITLSWELARPQLSGRSLGDTMSGAFAAITRPSGRYSFTVDNIVGSSHYFAPNVSNRSPAGLLAEVNGGLQAQNRCNCVVPANTENVRFGYYRLFSNSNLRLYRSDSNYTGRYTYWSDFSSRVDSETGLYRVAISSAP